MMKELIDDMKTYLFHYLVLLVILGLGVGMFYFFRFHPSSQAVVVLATSIVYILWGIIHHWLEGDLHLKIVLEYLLIALVADLIILSLLFRA